MRSWLVFVGFFVLTTWVLGGVAAGAAEPEWGYHGEIGPEHWGDLSRSFALCKRGQEQTPIDLSSEGGNAGCVPANVTFAYRNSSLTLFNNGETIRATPGGTPSTIRYAGERFDLIQFHWHTPSEHSVDGERTPIEMHFVHRNADGLLAVVGVFIVEGARNPALAPIFSRLPEEAGETTSVPSLSLDALLPADRTARWNYPGSLTTPGCNQGVRWTVLAEPIAMSATQVAAFTEIFSGAEFPEGNSRPVQPLFGRPVCTAGLE